MEEQEKRVKRPRISSPRPTFDVSNTPTNSSENDVTDSQKSEHSNSYNSYRQPSDNKDTQGGYRPQGQGGYRPQGQGGYRPQGQGGYRPQGQGGYRPQGQGGYRPQGQNDYRPQEQGGYRPQGQGGYRPQGQGGYRPQGGQQGGYRPQSQGGYRPQSQGGYRPQNQQGGYRQQNNQQGGYNRPYQNNYRNGGGNGYNRPQQGGYNNNGRSQQGGYRQQNNQQGGRFNKPQQMRFTPRPKRIEYEMPIVDPTQEVRLNKFMANAGICSRREADELIQQGVIKVNGKPVSELGCKITAMDVVEYQDKVVTLENKCYILLNKPKDVVTTREDTNGRQTVMDLIKGACTERVYPVGRLDRNTTGVLLLTNDGELASKLTHPQYIKKKIYHVWVDKPISEDDMQQIADGIELEDGEIHADAISYVDEKDKKQAGIEIHSGRNRIVRRIFESLGYHVTKLDRVYFAGLTKKNLPRGRWRYLTQEEVNFLKQNSFE